MLIWLVNFLLMMLILAAIFGVIRAVLALPLFGFLGPYLNVIYAILVLVFLIILVSMLAGAIAWPMRIHPTP